MNRKEILSQMDALRNEFIATIGNYLKDINDKVNICKIYGIIDDKSDIKYALDKIKALKNDYKKIEAMEFTSYVNIEQYEEYSTRFEENNNKLKKFLEFYVSEQTTKLN